MKLKLTLATATALGLLMGGAMADDNKAVSDQEGNQNTLSVKQAGNWNNAGTDLNTNNRLFQFGDSNSITVNQTGNSNNVGNDSDANHKGLHQTGVTPTIWVPVTRGDGNVIVIDQTSGAITGAANGNKISSIRQISGTGGSGTTNSASITQSLGGAGDRAAHYVGRVVQQHAGGAANTLTIEQTGSHTHSGPGGANAQSNRIGGYDDSGYQDWFGGIKQKGSGNTLTVTQQDLAGRRTGARGPGNVVISLDQDGGSLTATVMQDGFHNYVREIYQRGNNNTAAVSLTGTGNGAILPSGAWAADKLPVRGVLHGAAGEVGAAASSVVQIGGDGNQVEYTVFGGNENQFGFHQDGNDNQAVGIYITGDSNHLGVYQDGDDNALELAAIAGSDNVIGLKQTGDENKAKLEINGNGNGGLHSFTSPIIPTSLTAGLIEQDGNLNVATLTVVNGNNNVFGTLQRGDSNKITGTQNGNGNQAGVSQIGNTNVAIFAQNGTGNVVAVSQ